MAEPAEESQWKRAFIGRAAPPQTWDVSTALFLRGLGVIYLIAFVSFWVQLDGLIGDHGILPATTFFGRVNTYAELHELSAFRLAPSLSVLGGGDGFLHAQCALGALLAIVLIAGFLPSLTCLALWLLYLSITVAGQRFMEFQWENLLLECGVVAALLSPGTLWIRRAATRPESGGWRAALWLTSDHAPRVLGRFLLWWLLFRLMFQSGLVKLASNDDVWWNLSALSVHYWTQPIPNPVAWYMHQLPEWFGKLSVAVTYFIEIVCPFFIFAPRRLRRFAALAFLFLMTLIALTGNYAYFNLLAALLCILLIEDDAWPERIQRACWPGPANAKWAIPRTTLGAALGFAAVLVAFVQIEGGAFYVWNTSDRFLAAVRYRTDWKLNLPNMAPPPFMADLDSFRSINSYGLFANMTEERPEIVVEGSMDGVTWKEYEFRYKPGDPKRRPPFVAPYQPRLDWQMWFAALGTWRMERWFLPFMRRLLENEPAVIGLLEKNPFPDAPPKYIRATVYRYRFTTEAEAAHTGAWWVRSNPQPFFPPITKELYDSEIAPRL